MSVQLSLSRRLFARLAFATAVAALGTIAVACTPARPDHPEATPPPPETRVEALTETLHRVEVADPYRWLEDQRAPETRAWIAAQNAHTDAVLGSLPGRAELERLAGSVLQIELIGTPVEKGGRYFFSKRATDQDLSVLYVRSGVGGEDRVLLDPHPLSADHTTSVELADVSEDGGLVAYSVRRGGVDEIEVRLRRVDSGEDLADVLTEGRYGSIELDPGPAGFYYARYGIDTPQVLYHALGTEVAADRVLWQGTSIEQIPIAELSDDGRYLLLHVIKGSSGPVGIFVGDLRAGEGFTTVIDDGVSRSFAGFAGERLLITTDLEAPNKRVVLAEPSSPGVEHWRELLAERAEVVIQGASGVGGRILVSYLEDVQPRLAVYDLEGARVREIEAPTLGSFGGATGAWDRREVFYTFSTFHQPDTIYRHDLETGEQQVWARIEFPLDVSSFEVKQVRYRSKDGTEIPMFLVHERGTELDGSHPAYLTGYGGFNSSSTPSFSAWAAAWVARGGVYAVANLRGGGELGEAWHRAGMMANKQNVFDDFIAAAEYLIEEGYTRPERLAIRGGSNGGLLVGAVSNQRPELFGAVVCFYPLLDMVRYHQFLVARFWVPEYGSSEDAEQFRTLLAYSPYHNVRAGGHYPATLYISGDGDTRVDPLHARKMAALLQAKNGSDEPILLRYHTKAGHSGGQPVSERIDEMVEVLAFLSWQVGI